MAEIEFEGFDSTEEKLFSFYTSELLEHGFLISAVYHPKSIELTPDAFVHVYEQKKNFNELKKVKLLNGMVYEPDWKLEWADKADGIFTWHESGIYPKGFKIPFFAQNKVSYVDVKGGVVGRNNSSAITFPLKQKFLYDKEQIFIQKAIVTLDKKSIFALSFTPRMVVAQEIYKRDCKYGKAGDSKLKYTPILIEQFIKNK